MIWLLRVGAYSLFIIVALQHLGVAVIPIVEQAKCSPQIQQRPALVDAFYKTFLIDIRC